jgi:hypothetical protein
LQHELLRELLSAIDAVLHDAEANWLVTCGGFEVAVVGAAITFLCKMENVVELAPCNQQLI